MKITIEPTAYNEKRLLDEYHPTVSVEIPGNDHTLDQVIEHALVYALIAAGYSEELVRERLDCL